MKIIFLSNYNVRMIMGRKLACCRRYIRDMSIDYDEQERMNFIDNESGTSRGEASVTDSFDEYDSSCSSGTNASGSFSPLSKTTKKEDRIPDEWNFKATPQTSSCFSDVETMKAKFAKLLLGDDVTGGKKGVSTALALSNAINNLAGSVFGEVWKLEPLPEERKSRWKREMEWLLAPTNYIFELVPAKQNDVASGQTIEIMTPKARADISMNLPALRKLDSMLIETLESMVDGEFWYDEVGRGAKGGSNRWGLPSPRVPTVGLSEFERKKLVHRGKLIHQVFKAAKSINQNVLSEMPIPTFLRDVLPKSGKASLGEELYKIVSAESLSTEGIIRCINLKSEHGALEAINRLEAVVVVWKDRIAERNNGSSPVRTSWSFVRDLLSELDKTESLVNRAELLMLHLKNKYPNLPHTFIDVTKIQCGKDVGHSILEAYSRVLANLAFSILSRVGDILQEDIMSNPNSPVAMSRLVGVRNFGIIQ